MSKKIMIIASCLILSMYQVHAMFSSAKGTYSREAPGESYRRFYENPDNTQVRMWDQQTIVYPHEEKSKKTISTFGLRGCIALIYARKNAAGDSVVTINHYPPTHREQQELQLRRLIVQDDRSQVPIVQKSLIIATPGQYNEGSNGRWVFESQDPVYVQKLSGIGGGIAQSAPYSIEREAASNQSFYPCLIVQSDRNDQLVWSGKGDCHVPHPLFVEDQSLDETLDELD